MTPEVEKKRRELFEAWAADRLGWGDDELRRGTTGYYYWMEATDRFETWCAALDAVEIELPPSAQGTDGQKWLPVEAVEYAITATGLGLRIK